ncbi:MAG: family 16 glycoside hydrolase [Chthoniobacteraceae bacterium]
MKRLIVLLPLFILAAHAAPVAIFDGRTLDGWDYDPKIWRVEDGMISGGSTTEKIRENHFIATKKSYANFELRLKIKCGGDPATGMLNSGIQIRSLRVPGGAHMSGYQIDCGKGWFGKIYDEFRRNRVIAEPVDAAALEKVVDVLGWNEYRIRAEGPRIQTWINGVLAIDYTETDPNIALDGQIGPQVHSGGACLVQVKDVTIEELPPTPNAPTWEKLGGVEAARKLVAPPPKPRPGASAAPAKKDISYNAVQGTAKTAAEQQKLFRLPDGYEIELVLQESEGLGKFISVYFDQRGRMWTQTALEYPVDGNENAVAAAALYKSKAKDKVLVFPREALNAPLPAGGLTNPTIFADGLAIPLGILPWGAGDACYIQHGPDLKLFKDTNGDGRADTSEVVLTGFGVQDSHLFPHQFTRAPGGWIWMAQGLFNNSKPQKPGDEKAVDWPKCSMAKMRPDGSQFEVTSTGPNNIWGLVITGEGEAFIQEANDFGYPVMPFHEYAYYPGGMEPLRRSYQPEFPATAEFRMGGTGLSGLALVEATRSSLRAGGASPPDLVMAVANPIISKVQTLAMHRDGPRWRLEQTADLITCDDPFFRPVAMTNGPDGCIYIVDWYNKIISHNEVPRAHPDRDKTRGRIWRVKAKGAKPVEIPDFTKLSGDELIAKLGSEPLAQSHLAWQAFEDHASIPEEPAYEKLAAIWSNPKQPVARRVQALWCTDRVGFDYDLLIALERDPNPNVRREAIRAYNGWASGLSVFELADEFGDLANDPDPTVRRELLGWLGRRFIEEADLSVTLSGKLPKPAWAENIGVEYKGFRTLLASVKPPLDGPLAPSTRGGKPIKVREAYDREFERYLVRMFLEQHPLAVAWYLDSAAGESLPVEARLLASLALEPKASAARVAKLLPQLQRAPGQEEVLRLAQFPDEPGVGDALRAVLSNPATRTGVLEALLATRTRLDSAKLAPLLTAAAKQLLADPAGGQFGAQLAGAFQLVDTEAALVTLVENGTSESRDSIAGEPGHRTYLALSPVAVQGLKALREIRSEKLDLFDRLARFGQQTEVRDDALAALASSRSPQAGEYLLKLWPNLEPGPRRNALDRLASTKPGAKTIVGAIRSGTMKKDELDGPTVEKLQAVLGDDRDLAALLGELASLFRPVLAFDGKENAWTETGVTLDGPFTVESWVRLDPGITNADGILGAPGQLDINFHQSKFRVWVGGPVHDAIVSKKPMTPDLWTHVAVTRDAKGMFRLFQDGELVADESKVATAKFENVRIGWTNAKGGTAGALSELRIWKRVRTPEEIRRDFDRTLGGAASSPPSAAQRQPRGAPTAHTAAGTPPLLVLSSADGWGKVQLGAKLAKTSDFPPVMSVAEAAAVDANFAKFHALADKPGDATRGKNAAMLCSACHLFKGQGGNIGPDLSGVGAMGTEAILRNLLTPNAAMEAGYRIFRVELKNGDLLDAFFVSEDKNAVVVRQPGAPDRRIAKTEIRSTKYLRRSLMPEGLLETFTPEQISDLFAYLKSMK